MDERAERVIAKLSKYYTWYEEMIERATEQRLISFLSGLRSGVADAIQTIREEFGEDKK